MFAAKMDFSIRKNWKGSGSMKAICLLFCAICLLGSTGCTERTISAAVLPDTETKEEIAAPDIQREAQIDLSPFTEISVGQAIVSHVKEVSSVIVTDTKDGEVVYESTDELLSQSFYDALQIVNEEFDTLDIRPIDFEVHFVTNLGLEKTYGLWINFQKDNHAIVQWEDRYWDLPLDESNWLRSRIQGLI